MAADLSDTLGLLYETCCSDEAWSPTLAAMAELLGAERVVAAVEASDRDLPLVRAFPADGPEPPDVRPVLAVLRAGAPGEEIVDRAAAARGGLRRTRFYAGHVPPNGIGGHIQSLAFPDEWDAGTLYGARAPGAEPFGDRETGALRALLPHLARTVRMRVRFEALCAQEADLREALDRAPWPTLLVDAHARLVFANAHAERVLRSDDGLSVRRGVLAAETAADARRLSALVARAATLDGRACGGALLVRRTHAERALSVLVVPLGRRREDAGAGRVLVFLCDPDRGGGAGADQLRAWFDLTPSEAVVAQEICRGEGVASVAAKIGVGAATVKTHLLHVFAKTGVTRQAELARLVGRLPWAE